MKRYVKLYKPHAYVPRPVPAPGFWRAGLPDEWINAAFGLYATGDFDLPDGTKAAVRMPTAFGWGTLLEVWRMGDERSDVVEYTVTRRGGYVCKSPDASPLVHAVFAAHNARLASGYMPAGGYASQLRWFRSADGAYQRGSIPGACYLDTPPGGPTEYVCGSSLWPIVPPNAAPDVLLREYSADLDTSFKRYARADLHGASLFTKVAPDFQLIYDREIARRCGIDL